MWRFLRAVVDYERLQTENTGLREEITLLRGQLFEEIDSNRRREDGLVRAIAGTEDLDRRQSVLTPFKPLSEDREEGPPIPELVFGSTTEEAVKLRARDYMAEAAKNGVYYDFEELCKAIKENPQEFLSN